MPETLTLSQWHDRLNNVPGLAGKVAQRLSLVWEHEGGVANRWWLNNDLYPNGVLDAISIPALVTAAWEVMGEEGYSCSGMSGDRHPLRASPLMFMDTEGKWHDDPCRGPGFPNDAAALAALLESMKPEPKKEELPPPCPVCFRSLREVEELRDQLKHDRDHANNRLDVHSKRIDAVGEGVGDLRDRMNQVQEDAVDINQSRDRATENIMARIAELEQDDECVADRIAELEKVRGKVAAAVEVAELHGRIAELEQARTLQRERMNQADLEREGVAADLEALDQCVQNLATEMDGKVRDIDSRIAAGATARDVLRLRAAECEKLRAHLADANAHITELRARIAEQDKVAAQLSTQLGEALNRMDGVLEDKA